MIPILSTVGAVYLDVFGADLLRYACGAGGVYLIVNVLFARHLVRQKIRSADPPRGQIRREIIASLRTVAIFAATGSCIAFGARAGLFEIYPAVATYGLPYLIMSAITLVVLHDAWFYWSHRALHHPPLFRRFHRLHHRSHNPTPFTSYSFDVGEAVVNAIFLPLALLFVPAHPIALFFFVTHMMLRNAIGHCGIEIFPARANGRPLVGWLTTVTHHDLHHAHAGYNMGLYFTWWDRWMGTEHPKYLETFQAVAPRIGARGSRAGILGLCLASVLWSADAEAFELKGQYATPGLGAVIEFRPCDSDSQTTCGHLLWVWDPAQTPHAKVGDVLAPGLTFDGSVWRGRMLDPENGWTFKGTVRSATKDRLVLRGCAGPICVSQVWHSTANLRRVLAQVR